MKAFNQIFFGAVLAAVLLGWILPALFSSRSMEGPLLGALIVGGILYGAGRFAVSKMEGKKK